jgi:hypothetical protein
MVTHVFPGGKTTWWTYDGISLMSGRLFSTGLHSKINADIWMKPSQIQLTLPGLGLHARTRRKWPTSISIGSSSKTRGGAKYQPGFWEIWWHWIYCWNKNSFIIVLNSFRRELSRRRIWKLAMHRFIGYFCVKMVSPLGNWSQSMTVKHHSKMERFV